MKINKISIKIILLILLNKIDYMHSSLQQSIIRFKEQQQQQKKSEFEKKLISLIENKPNFEFYIKNNKLSKINSLLDIIKNKNGSYNFETTYQDQLGSIFEIIKNDNDLISGYLETLNKNVIINNNNNDNNFNNIKNSLLISQFIYKNEQQQQQIDNKDLKNQIILIAKEKLNNNKNQNQNQINILSMIKDENFLNKLSSEDLNILLNKLLNDDYMYFREYLIKYKNENKQINNLQKQQLQNQEDPEYELAIQQSIIEEQERKMQQNQQFQINNKLQQQQQQKMQFNNLQQLQNQKLTLKEYINLIENKFSLKIKYEDGDMNSIYIYNEKFNIAQNIEELEKEKTINREYILFEQDIQKTQEEKETILNDVITTLRKYEYDEYCENYVPVIQPKQNKQIQNKKSAINRDDMINFIKNKILQNKEKIEGEGIENNHFYSLLTYNLFFEKLTNDFIGKIYLSLLNDNNKNILFILNELDSFYNLKSVLKTFSILDKIKTYKNYLIQNQDKLDYIEFAQNNLPEIKNLIEIIQNKNIKLDELIDLFKLDSGKIDEIYEYFFNTKIYFMNKIIGNLINMNFKFKEEFINNIIDMSLNQEGINENISYEAFINIFEYFKKNDIQNINEWFNSFFSYFNLNNNNNNMNQSIIQNQNQQIIEAPKKKELEYGSIYNQNDFDNKADYSEIKNLYSETAKQSLILLEDLKENIPYYINKVIKKIFIDYLWIDSSNQYEEQEKDSHTFIKLFNLFTKYNITNIEKYKNITNISSCDIRLNDKDDTKEKKIEYIKNIIECVNLIINPNEALLELMQDKFKNNNYLMGIYNEYKEVSDNGFRMNLEDIIHSIKLLNDNNFPEFIRLLRSYNTYFSNNLVSRIN